MPVDRMELNGSGAVFRSIQALRALAAFMIVLYHARGLAGLEAVETSTGLPPWLTSGVDIFFVISGFVMTASTQGKRLRADAFLAARLIRIVPLYWIALSTLLVFMALGWSIHPWPPAGEIAKSYLFVFYTDRHTGEMAPFLVPGWSLNYEMYFYLVFAALIWLPARPRIMAIALFFLVSVAMRRFLPASDAIVFRLTSPLPFEFVAGMAIAVVRAPLGRVPPPLGLGAMFVGFLALAAHIALPRTLAFGVPAALIVAGAVVAEPLFRARAAVPLHKIGDASYSLYLSHGFTFALLRVAGIGPAASLAWLLFGLAAAVAASFAVHHGIERPVTEMLRRAIGRGIRSRAKPDMAPT